MSHSYNLAKCLFYFHFVTIFFIGLCQSHGKANAKTMSKEHYTLMSQSNSFNAGSTYLSMHLLAARDESSPSVRKVVGDECAADIDCPTTMVCVNGTSSICICNPMYGYTGAACQTKSVQTWVGIGVYIFIMCLWTIIMMKASMLLRMHYRSIGNSGGPRTARGAVITFWFFGGILGIVEEIMFILVQAKAYSDDMNHFIDIQVQGIIETIMGLCILLATYILAVTWLGIVASTKNLSQTKKDYLLKARKYIVISTLIFASAYPILTFSGQVAAGAIVMGVWAILLAILMYYGGSSLSSLLDEIDMSISPSTKLAHGRVKVLPSSGGPPGASQHATSQQALSRGAKMQRFTRIAASTLLGFMISNFVGSFALKSNGYIPMISFQVGLLSLAVFGWRSLEYTGASLLNTSNASSHNNQ